MIYQALSYRVGSFLLAVVIATLILEQFRDSLMDSATISIITSGVLQVTHTGYYIVFHRLWKRFGKEG